MTLTYTHRMRLAAMVVLATAISAAGEACRAQNTIFGTFSTSGTYDEQVTNEANNLMNAVEVEAAGNNVTLAQFKIDVQNAFNTNKGGVCSFDNDTNATEASNVSFVSLVGSTLATQLVTTRTNGAGIGLNNNSNNNVISGFNYLGLQGSASPCDLSFSLPLDTFAITALSRGGDRDMTLTIKYDNATTQVFPLETVGAADDDTVFIWKAPANRTITGVNFTNNGFIRYDDFGFILANFQPGDVDGDLDVDTIDYNAIRNNFGLSPATKAQGDLNGDGIVNLVDFQQWKANEAIASTGAVAAIPEPASLTLVATALCVIARIRNRR